MKIAVCFSGRVLTYEDMSEWFQKWVQTSEHEIHTFCSINGQLDEYHANFIKQFEIKKHHFQTFFLPFDASIFIGRKRGETNVYNFHSMWFNRKRVVELVERYQVENDITYDIVLHFRADIKTHQDLVFNIPEDDDSLYVPHGSDWCGLNDQVAYGKMAAIKKYSNMHDFIQKYVFVDKLTLHPERLLMHHIKQCGLNIKRFRFQYYLNHMRLSANQK
jgi:hypothetical protein